MPLPASPVLSQRCPEGDPLKIVVVNQHPHDALGGSEIQCDLIARGLTDIGHEVTYIAVQGRGGYSGLPYQAVPVPLSARAIIRACILERPDVVYWRLNKKRFRAVGKALFRQGIPFVFAISSDKDVLKWNVRPPGRGGIAGPIAHGARAVASAWNHRGFDYVSGIVSLNPDYVGVLPHQDQIFIGNSMPTVQADFVWPRPYVAWVANVKRTKRPEVCVDLARAVGAAGVDVVMIGRLVDRGYSWLTDPTGLPPNLHFVGPRSVEEVNGAFAGAVVSAHSCHPEGFGNTFIQAWLQGRPTVSLGFDPGGLIRGEGLGAVADDDEQRFHQDVMRFISDPALRRAVGDRARTFASENFSTARNVARLESYLTSVVARATDGSRGRG